MCGSGQAVLRAVVSAALAGRLGDEVSFVLAPPVLVILERKIGHTGKSQRWQQMTKNVPFRTKYMSRQRRGC